MFYLIQQETNILTMDLSRRKSILVIDDDVSVLASLTLLLKQAGFAIVTAEDPAQALQLLTQHKVHLVLQDMNFSQQTSGAEGLTLLIQIKSTYPDLPVLLMTAWGSIALAVKGVKAGATDFFTKPWQNSQLLQLIQTTLELASQPSDHRLSREVLDQQFSLKAIVGEHPELLKVLSTLARVAGTKAPVLILGESGTGKELIAEAIHRNSPRADRAMVKLNMGAISSGLFESEMFGHVKGAFTDARVDRKGHVASADQSTLFLDEIGELQRADQVKLLRVLQDQSFQAVGSSQLQRVDIRVVCATNQELAELVASGDFREDLFYRLNLITLRLPPLRERRSDIPLIAKQALLDIASLYQLGELSLSVAALDWLAAQAWPGNIRQLKQTLERAVLLSDNTLIDLQALQAGQMEKVLLTESQNVSGMTLEQAEKHLIDQALLRFEGNISKVAKSLGLSRAALYRRLDKFGLASSNHQTYEDD